MVTRRHLFAWAAALGTGALGIAAAKPAEAQPFLREDERPRREPPHRHRRPPPPPRRHRRYARPDYRR